MADYSKYIQEQEKNVTSLSDRLALIDQVTRGATSKGINYMQELPRTPLEAPLGVAKSSLALGTDALLQRSAAQADRDSGLKQLAELLGLEENQRSNKENEAINWAELGLKAKEAGTSEEDLAVADAYIDQIKKGLLKIESVPAADRKAVVKRISEQGLDIKKISEEGKNEKLKEFAQQLYDMYYGTDQEEDLAYGPLKGAAKNIEDKFTKRVAGGRLTRYHNLRNSGVAGFKAFFGETGVLTDRDIIRLISAIPDTNLPPQTAEGAWSDLFQRFGGSEETSGLDAEDEALINQFKGK